MLYTSGRISSQPTPHALSRESGSSGRRGPSLVVTILGCVSSSVSLRSPVIARDVVRDRQSPMLVASSSAQKAELDDCQLSRCVVFRPRHVHGHRARVLTRSPSEEGLWGVRVVRHVHTSTLARVSSRDRSGPCGQAAARDCVLPIKACLSSRGPCGRCPCRRDANVVRRAVREFLTGVKLHKSMTTVEDMTRRSRSVTPSASI